MRFSFCKYGRTGALALALLAAGCQRQPLGTVNTAPASRPETALAASPFTPPPPVETGVSEALAVARKQNISGVAYTLNLTIPAQRSEPIAVQESVSFYLKDNQYPVQLDFKAATKNLHSLTVNGQTIAIDHRNEHLVLPAAALKKGRNVVEIGLMAGE